MELLNPVDIHVGNRVRATRVFRNLDLWELASAVKISVLDLIAYEAGSMRFLPIHLIAIATRLDVRSTLFFDGLHQKTLKRKSRTSFDYSTPKSCSNDNFARVRYPKSGRNSDPSVEPLVV
jgi:hypothetical protein